MDRESCERNSSKVAEDRHGNKSKRRGKKKAVVEYRHKVSNTQFSKVCIKDVAKASRTTVKVECSSSSPDTTSLVIRGTRRQVREALQTITTLTGQQETMLEEARTFWKCWVGKAFPGFESKTYFLPPVCIKRLPLIGKIFAAQKIGIVPLKNAQESCADLVDAVENCTGSVRVSDAADDLAFQRIFYSLKKFSRAQKEVFMCLSQYPFGSYLGEPFFADAAANLPMPTNLPKEIPWEWRRGDFDLLIIHKQYGFVIVEMKAIGYYPAASQEELGKQVTEKLIKAKKQLDKAEIMLSHLVSDIAKGVRITKVIACPNLTTSQVEKVVSEDQQLVKELCQCFKISEANDIKRHVLCSNHLLLPDPPHPFSDYDLQELKFWWQELIAKPGPDHQFCECPDLYGTLIARFCGPASTVTMPSTTEPRVSIKTWDQAVSYVGDCYTGHVTLFPEQIELLCIPPPRVFIVGPPGTGKTVVLLLMAAEWLSQGHDVKILSTWDRSLAATFMLRHLLQEIIETRRGNEIPPGRVHVLQKNFKDKDEADDALNELASAAGNGPLYVIADEVGPDFLGSQHYIFSDFCSKLLQCFKESGELYFWGASCRHEVAPEEPFLWKGWGQRYFKRPLRSPPTVTKEIEQAVEITKDSIVPGYDKSAVPDYIDDPPVEWVFHTSQEHRSTRVEGCDICGENVARFLAANLRLGASTLSCTAANGSTAPACLRFKDVLILSWVELPEDTGIVKALKQRNVPVRVMRDLSDIEDVATARSDVVWAVQQQLVLGLERKVVIVVNNYDDSKGQYVSTRLRAMSRCSSQLVVVCPPPGYEPD